MKLKQKKIISLLLSLILVIGAIPFCPFSALAFSQEDLIESIAEGYDIKLENDIYPTKCIVIPAGADVVIDLNGKKLDRGLKTCIEDGSVIRVEKGAKLKIKDSTGYNAGMITFGAAYKGGGIYNCGTTILEGGTLCDNLALNDNTGFGGAIYNDTGATLSLKGGIIEYNRARVGAGVYNAKGATLNVQGVKYEISKGAVKYQIYDNAHISNNKAKADGSGIANFGEMNLKDAPVIEENNDDDVYLKNGTKINVTGELKGQKGSKAHVGLKTDSNRTDSVTEGYGAYNGTVRVDEYFFADGDSMLLNSNNNDSLEAALKNTTNTVVQVFRDGKLERSEEYANPQDAWNKAYFYAEASNGYNTSDIAKVFGFFTNGKLLHLDYEGLCQVINNYTFEEKCRVDITLGSDWEHDSELVIKSKASMIIDLNGHYIKRKRNYKQVKNGGVFYVSKNAKLIIKDSRPNSKGYDGIRGGVITGGASENTGGAIHMADDTIVDIEGGTIYECTTCEHGGAINMSDGSAITRFFTDVGYAGRTLIMQNCRIWFCQTVDSLDYCNGGGLYVDDNTNVYLNNVTIQDCYSEDSGGGIFLDNDNCTNIHMENCKLIGNTCRDNGGAICVRGSDDASYETIGAYNCTFIGNKAEESGGAVFVDGRGKEEATHFANCVFKNNETGDDGAAIYCNADNVVIDGCTITENTAKDKGAVYCDSYYDVNVQGLLTVRDNQAGDSNNQNFVLQDGVASTAYVYSGGLYEGSYISISSTSGGKTMISKEMSKYQSQYFHPEEGEIDYEHTKDVDAKIVTASVFGGGSVIKLLLIIAAGAAVLIAAVVIKKKRGGADDDDDEE